MWSSCGLEELKEEKKSVKVIVADATHCYYCYGHKGGRMERGRTGMAERGGADRAFWAGESRVWGGDESGATGLEAPALGCGSQGPGPRSHPVKKETQYILAVIGNAAHFIPHAGNRFAPVSAGTTITTPL